MMDTERDQLLLELRDRLVRVEATQAAHGAKLDTHGAKLDALAEGQDSLEATLAAHGAKLAAHGAKLDALAEGQDRLRDDLTDAFNEALVRAAQGQLTNIRQFRKEATGV